MEKSVYISDRVKNGCPDYSIIYMEAEVENRPTANDNERPVNDQLAKDFNILTKEISNHYEIADINKRPAIAATRQAYKIFGKDPNRYRPSQEQLMRRVVRGLGLYNVNALVDTGNILSLRTGCSVGVFDRDKIVGDTITVGVGQEGEEYTGIGRGPLNISGIPVIRDEKGGFGTPTSDHERTKTELTTQRISVTVHVFNSEEENIDNIISLMKSLFERHCNAKSIEITVKS